MLIVIGYILMQLLLRAFFHQDRTMMFCGIAGISAKRKLTPTQLTTIAYKMKILGLYNESRGTHGCGVYWNGKLYKGYEDKEQKIDNCKITNFLAQSDFILPPINGKLPVNILLHTRQSGASAHTYDNTHPFYIYNEEDQQNEMFFMHNGVIRNTYDLAKDNGLKSLDFLVDSQLLGTLISKKGVKVLEEYTGFAALMWVKVDDPNSMYVYHGKSKSWSTSQNAEEERPLFFMGTTEGIYFSSLKESLMAIRETKEQTPLCLNHNHVFKLTDGIFTSEVVAIDRDTIMKRQVSTTYASEYSAYENCYSDDWRDRKYGGYQTNCNFPVHRATQHTIAAKKKPTISIYSEAMPLRAAKEDRIFFFQGRFWNADGRTFCHGELRLTPKGVLVEKNAIDRSASFHYFWKGVKLSTSYSLNSLEKLAANPKTWVNNSDTNFAFFISVFATHPTINLPTEGKYLPDDIKGIWYYNKVRVSDKSFSVQFSSRRYNIESGNLTEITSSEPEDKHTLVKEDSANDVIDAIEGQSSSSGVWDIMFHNSRTAKNILSAKETFALILYFKNAAKMSKLPHGTELIMDQIDDFLKMIDAKSTTLRDLFGDTQYSLEGYESIVENDGITELELFKDKFDDLPFDKESIDGSLDAEEELYDASISDSEGIDKLLTEMENENNKQNLDTSLSLLMEDVVDRMSEIKEISEELQTYENEYADEFSKETLKGLDTMKHNLVEIAENHVDGKMQTYINRKINI